MPKYDIMLTNDDITSIRRFYRPALLSLVITYKCNAQCSHCCFECSPSNNIAISPEMIEKILRESKTFTKITISGGEPFLDFMALESLIEAVSDCGNFREISVVTNCYWAGTFEKAIKILTNMKMKGLGFLGISCDEFHKEFIPFKNVVNAVKAALETGIHVQLNVILGYGEFQKKELPEYITDMILPGIGENKLLKESVTEFSRSFKGEKTGITVLCGKMSPAGRAPTCPGGDIGYSSVRPSWDNGCILKPGMSKSAHENQVFFIHPDDRCFPCCSLYSFENHLCIGNLKENSISEIIERANNDQFLKMVSRIGLSGIKEVVDNHFERYRNAEFSDVCGFCRDISSDMEIKKAFGWD